MVDGSFSGGDGGGDDDDGEDGTAKAVREKLGYDQVSSVLLLSNN
jgi:hypothetical protein